jgi:hypothetical protein
LLVDRDIQADLEDFLDFSSSYREGPAALLGVNEWNIPLVISYTVASLANIAKLIVRIKNNPKDVRFDDACKVAAYLGFIGKGGKGHHHSFSKPGEPEGLNFQKRQGGKIKP